MELHRLIEDHQSDYENSIRNDGQLEARLKCLDGNIEMFKNYKGEYAQARLKEMIDGKEQLKQFYAGKIKRSDVHHSIWTLTSSMPDWGTYGT